jgi:hypothetical protein
MVIDSASPRELRAVFSTPNKNRFNAEFFARAIPEEYWKDVFYNNALTVYKIPGLEPLH